MPRRLNQADATPAPGRPRQPPQMTHRLLWSGQEVATCTVDRLMRGLGISGACRGQWHPDLLNPGLTAPDLNTCWAAPIWCHAVAQRVVVRGQSIP